MIRWRNPTENPAESPTESPTETCEEPDIGTIYKQENSVVFVLFFWCLRLFTVLL